MSEPCRHERERLDMLEEWAVVLAERNAALATIERIRAIVAEPGCHPRTDRIRAALESSS